MDGQQKKREGFLSYGWPFIFVVGSQLASFIISLIDQRLFIYTSLLLGMPMMVGLFAGMIKFWRALKSTGEDRPIGSLILNGFVTLFLLVYIIMSAVFSFE